MLRIRADRWREFCLKAENLGFKGDWHYYQDNVDSNREAYIIVQRKDDVAWEKGEIIYRDNADTNKAFSLLYDLIAQGYVEKA